MVQASQGSARGRAGGGAAPRPQPLAAHDAAPMDAIQEESDEEPAYMPNVTSAAASQPPRSQNGGAPAQAPALARPNGKRQGGANMGNRQAPPADV